MSCINIKKEFNNDTEEDQKPTTYVVEGNVSIKIEECIENPLHKSEPENYVEVKQEPIDQDDNTTPSYVKYIKEELEITIEPTVLQKSFLPSVKGNFLLVFRKFVAKMGIFKINLLYLKSFES